jgi:hypothetical protein
VEESRKFIWAGKANSPNLPGLSVKVASPAVADPSKRRMPPGIFFLPPATTNCCGLPELFVMPARATVRVNGMVKV